ncbi:hypothetical protein ACWOEH_06710 [Enterococcus nangangensis]
MSKAGSKFKVRYILEGIAVLGILICGALSFYPTYRGTATYTLDQQQIVYHGQVAKGRFNGQGKITFPDGASYQGNFKRGRFDGAGKFTAAAGWVYEGEFVRGVPQGQGKLTTTDQAIYQGTFKDGEFQDAD